MRAGRQDERSEGGRQRAAARPPAGAGQQGGREAGYCCKAGGVSRPNYIDDFAAVIREPFALSTLKKQQEIVKRISRTGYGKVLMEDIFWQGLTLIAINMKNNDLLAQYIRKMEQLRGGLNNEEE